MSKKPTKTIEEIFRLDGRYPFEAAQFVREGLSHTVEKDQPDRDEPRTARHISGAQLCQGLRQLALKRWGLLARSVLKRWNINTTRDFGEIVFILVKYGWMQKEPSDRIENFDAVYDFSEAFHQDFEISFDN